jgi:UDP-N-acetylmuramate dehydrogenase
MMALTTPNPHLIDRLPKPRGRLAADAPLGPQTWFRAGGPAEVLVIRLMRGFTGIEVEGREVVAGAGALDLNVALTARDHALAGLEFLSGIPGTIGGAVAMNAGAYQGDLAQVMISAEAVDRAGHVYKVDVAKMGFSYRRSQAPADWIFTSARLKATPGDQLAIARRIAEIDAARTDSQPRSRTGGSTFVNPPGHKAWQLIDRAGCRGLRFGEAQVSEKHCNFLINLGAATAADVETLGEEVRRRVFEQSGVRLEWEIRRIGVSA